MKPLTHVKELDCSTESDKTSKIGMMDEEKVVECLLSSSNNSEERISIKKRVKARSERKRNREKRRRDDVNEQLGRLTELLRQIEEEVAAGQDDAIDTSLLNRVSLIARAKTVLEREHTTSKQWRDEIFRLQARLTEAKEMAKKTSVLNRLDEESKSGRSFASPNKQIMVMVPMMVAPDVTRATAPDATAMMQSRTTNVMMNNLGMMQDMRSQSSTTTPPQSVILPQNNNLPHNTNYNTNQLGSHMDLMPRELPFQETENNLSHMTILSAALNQMQEAYQSNQTTMPSSQPSYQGSQPSNFSQMPSALEQLGLGSNRLNQGNYAFDQISEQLRASINLSLSDNLQQTQTQFVRNQAPSMMPSMLGQSQQETSSQILAGCTCWDNSSIEPCECWKKTGLQKPCETETSSLGLDVSQLRNSNALLMAQQSIVPLREFSHTARRNNFPVSF